MAGEGMGFGLGQMLQQGGMGQAQYAPQTMNAAAPGGLAGMLPGLAGLFGGGDQAGQGIDMTKLGPLMQMMQMHQQSQQQQPQMMDLGPMAGSMRGNMQGQTQAQRGYLAQGGGIAPRQIINRG